MSINWFKFGLNIILFSKNYDHFYQTKKKYVYFRNLTRTNKKKFPQTFIVPTYDALDTYNKASDHTLGLDL